MLRACSQKLGKLKLQSSPCFFTYGFIIAICFTDQLVLFALCTFQLTVPLLSFLARVIKPWGQVFIPSVWILLYLKWVCFKDTRFLCLCYQKLLYFASPEIIILTKLGCDCIKILFKTILITMGLPLGNTFHIFFCVVLAYPLITFQFNCRSGRSIVISDGVWLVYIVVWYVG